MQSKKSLVIISLIFYSLLLQIHLLGSNTPLTYDSSPPTFSSLLAHSYINIENDTAFITYGFLGDGTENEPYRIENLNITTSNDYAVFITNTTKHFLISNCLLKATTSGIWVEDVASNTVNIVNNTCNKDMIYGIEIRNADYSFVANNTCKDNYRHGIVIGTSLNCVIANNTCIINEWIGIFLHECNFSHVENNICRANGWGGIIADDSSGIIIKRNECYDNDYTGGIRIYGSPFSQVLENKCEDNIPRNIQSYDSPNSIISKNNVSGTDSAFSILESQNTTICGNLCLDSEGGMLVKNSKESKVIENSFICSGVKFVEDIVGDYSSYTVEKNSINGKVIIINCNHSEIQNQMITNTTNSISIKYCADILIKNSFLIDNIEGGVEIDQSTNINILNNTISQNDFYGIYAQNTTSSKISFNCFEKNYLWAIILDELCKNNLVHHNSFLYNNLYYGTAQAADDGKDNLWYDIETEEGNYWNNYDGSGNYSIDGLANAYDLYPLTEPPIYVPPNYYGYFAFFSILLFIPIFFLVYRRYKHIKS